MRGVELLSQRQYGDAVVTHARSRGVFVNDTADMREAVHQLGFIKDIDKVVARSRDQFMRDIDALLKRSAEAPHLRAVAPSAGFVVNTGGSAVALSAATAKTIMYLKAASQYEPSLTELSVAFDGVTASAIPVLVELCFGTAATNSTPGTASTSFTPLWHRNGPVKTSSCTAANVCTSEPTVLVSHKQWLVTPNGGLLIVQFPLGREPTGIITASTSGLMLAIRETAPATVNSRGYLEFEE